MKGNTTKITVKNGVKIKEITTNPTLFLMYAKIQLLLNPSKTEKLLNGYGKYFHDFDIVEANVHVL